MLLIRTLSMRAAVGYATVVLHLWPGFALAQAQVEAVPDAPPAFDMWDLEAIQDPEIQLPDDSVLGLPYAPEPAPPPDSIADDQSSNDDPCRHFTEEERRLLPSLCDPTD